MKFAQTLQRINIKEFLFYSGFFISFFLWDTEYKFIKGIPLILLFFSIDFNSIFESLKKLKFFICFFLLVLFHKIILNFYFEISFGINDIYFFVFFLILGFSILSNFQILHKASKYSSITFLLLMFCLILLNFQTDGVLNWFNGENDRFKNYNMYSQGACNALTLNTSSLNFRIFKENSHFGMIGLFPLIYFVINYQRKFLPLLIAYLFICLFYFSFTLLISTIIVGASSILFFKNNKKIVFYFIAIVVFSLGYLKLNKDCSSRLQSLKLNDLSKLDYINKEIQNKNMLFLENFNGECLNISNQKDEKEIYNIKSQYFAKNLEYEKLIKLKLTNMKLAKQYQLTEKVRILKNERNQLIIKLVEFVNANPDIIKNCKHILKHKDEVYKQINIKRFDSKIIEHNNVTVSVYYNSFLVALKSLKKYPLGVGLNNYHIAHNQFTSENLFESQNQFGSVLHPEVVSLNVKDGRNNLLKIVVEFGIFSIFFAMVFLLVLYNIFKYQNILNLLFLTNICTQLLSGAGYINGGFIFSILILLVINFLNEKKI